jgi:hypothetical protein
VGDPVALLLADQDVAGQLLLAVRVVAQHVVEEIGRAEDVPRGLLEEVEVLAVLRDQDL